MSPNPKDTFSSVEIKAPNALPWHSDMPSVFLAGSIEMGKAVDWQSHFAANIHGFNVLNPRRDDWDSTWIQSIDNPQFRRQVEWELHAMHFANVIVFNFCAGLMAPITLLELGLITNRRQSQHVAVHCPEGFWRKGNVDIVCEWHDIPQVNSLDDLIWWCQSKLENRDV